jgi:hypothetical protein
MVNLATGKPNITKQAGVLREGPGRVPEGHLDPVPELAQEPQEPKEQVKGLLIAGPQSGLPPPQPVGA